MVINASVHTITLIASNQYYSTIVQTPTNCGIVSSVAENSREVGRSEARQKGGVEAYQEKG